MELHPYCRKAQFYETDAMGVVHHANYVYWMEEARTDFMDQIGYPYQKCATEHGIDMALTGIECQYKGMVRFGETVRIVMSITKLTPARLVIHYDMYDSATGDLRFEGESSHFFYLRAKNRPVALKRVLPDLYQLLSSLCTGADRE